MNDEEAPASSSFNHAADESAAHEKSVCIKGQER